MDVFGRNIANLKKRFPELVELAATSSSPRIEVVPSRSGPATLRKDGRFLHSAYDPVAEASSFVSRSGVGEADNVILLGMGLGYPLSQLVSSGRRVSNVFVVEPDPAVFAAALRHTDLTALLDRRNVHFLVGKSPDEVYSYLTDFTIRLLAADICILELQPELACERRYFETLKPKIADAVRTAAANVNTIKRCGLTCLENACNNFFEAVKSPGIASLFGRFQEVPAVLVSAGPSLDKNVDELARYKGKCLILATDTAFKILLRHGIRPDLIFTADFKEISRLHFENTGVDDIPLVFEPEAARASLEAYAGPRFVCASSKPFPFWINTTAPDKGFLQKGMSVAHFAFAAAVKMGCAPIIFIGQDLSFPGGYSHAQGTTSRIAVDPAANKSLVKITSLLTGEELYTDMPMYVYRTHFAQLVRKCGVECINSTEGGAGIEGTAVMPLAGALAKYCHTRVDIQGILSGAAESAPKADLADVRGKLNGLLRKVKRMLEANSRVIGILDELFALAVQPQPDEGKAAALLESLKAPSRVIQREEFILRVLHSEIVKEIMQLEREREFRAPDMTGKSLSDLPGDFREDYGFQQAIRRGLSLLQDTLGRQRELLSQAIKNSKVNPKPGR